MNDRFRISLKDSAAEISRKFSSTSNVNILHKLVSQRLRGSGLLVRAPIKRVLISKKNQRARLRFAHEHVVRTGERWSEVRFNDESKYMIDSNGGCTSDEEIAKGYLVHVWRQ